MIKYSVILIVLLHLLLRSDAFHTPDVVSMKKQIQESTFRLITSLAYRNAQFPYSWCEEARMEGGRPYDWGTYRGLTVNLIDIYHSLQFDPDCEVQLLALRKLLLDTPDRPASYGNSSVWWETTFLDASIDAFTCGFNGSKIEDFDFVSHDLRENFNTDLKKQKIWYLIGDYMLSIYKQRENNNRRLDFDAGLYIPFLDKLTGGDYTKTNQMRVGFPTYMGRTLWFLFHTIAQRIADSPCTDFTEIYGRVHSFMTYFATSHPCPFCRVHFVEHVSVNDRYAQEPLSSEAIRYYPIEHLLNGGIEGTLASKLSAIKPTDKDSLAIFFWKLHNAVTSSVEMGCSCFTEEIEDKDPYACIFNPSTETQASYPRIGRAFPFLKRFEFILTENHNYTLFDEARASLLEIIKNISSIDNLTLRKELWYYWNNKTLISETSNQQVIQLTELIENMSKEVLKLPILTQYTYGSTSLDCDKLTQELGKLTTNEAIPPPDPTKITREPEICAPYKTDSACQKSYPTPLPTITVKPEDIVPPDNSTKSGSVKLSWSFSILLLNVILFLILIN